MNKNLDDLNDSDRLTVRVEIVHTGWYHTISSDVERKVPSALLEQKIALMKAAPVGARIDDVGWRRSETVFYIRIFDHELIGE